MKHCGHWIFEHSKLFPPRWTHPATSGEFLGRSVPTFRRSFPDCRKQGEYFFDPSPRGFHGFHSYGFHGKKATRRVDRLCTLPPEGLRRSNIARIRKKRRIRFPFPHRRGRERAEIGEREDTPAYAAWRPARSSRPNRRPAPLRRRRPRESR